MNNQVAEHYTRGNLPDVLLGAVRKSVGDGGTVTIDDLAPVDEFHIGGRRASAHLFEQLDLRPASRVLDIGAGIGGTARYVAHTFGCPVTGIDLTAEFCQVANKLTDLVGHSDRVNFMQGDALSMPFGDDSFDIAYMMHVGMNIVDKQAVFKEARRVLRQRGVLAIYDVLRGPGRGALKFPVPWASVPEHSHVASLDEMTEALSGAGFQVERTSDRTTFALQFFESAVAASASGPPLLGLHLIMGPDARVKFSNMLANVRDGVCGTWEIICKKGR